MKVLITGTSGGIGKAAAIRFLKENHEVYGIDILPDSISGEKGILNSHLYRHFIADISEASSLPEISGIEILVNNAGIQTDSEKDMEVNLLGAMYVTEKYAFQPCIRSVVFNASVSALTGNEFKFYVMSKSGLVGYMKYCAIKLANQFKATCNALCFGGVLTELNYPVTEDENLFQKIMDVTPLKRWATPEEAADWIYFISVVNQFCTGQAIDISGGERNALDLFVWK